VEIGFRVLPPVFIEHLADAVHDAIGAGLIGKEVVYQRRTPRKARSRILGVRMDFPSFGGKS